MDVGWACEIAAKYAKGDTDARIWWEDVAPMLGEVLVAAALRRAAHPQEGGDGQGWIKPTPKPLACYGCGLRYGSPGWMDAVVPDDVWLKISPTGHEGGILCVCCMARRCATLGLETTVMLTSGPFEALWAQPAGEERSEPSLEAAIAYWRDALGPEYANHPVDWQQVNHIQRRLRAAYAIDRVGRLTEGSERPDDWPDRIIALCASCSAVLPTSKGIPTTVGWGTILHPCSRCGAAPGERVGRPQAGQGPE